ncbi:hypothetical protein RQP46_006155 [Phenoliferia psychrophenolica]
MSYGSGYGQAYGYGSSSGGDGYSGGYSNNYSQGGGGGSYGYGPPASSGSGGWGQPSGSSYGGGDRRSGGGGAPRDDRMSTLGDNLRSQKWDMASLVPFEKDFYEEEPLVTVRSDQEVQDYRLKHKIIVFGKNVPKPITTFGEAGFPPYISQEITNAGFTIPSPIQCQAWPMALSGRDLVAVSATGSGKTIAFALPAMIHINAQPLLAPGDGPIVLIIAPTRELAVQIQSECTKFGKSSQIRNTCVYGGVPKGKFPAFASLSKQGIDPLHRLIDMLESGKTTLRRVTYLVIDEADRMLDMGFEPQIKKILDQIRPDRQSLMFSATWPREVQELAREYLKDFIQVTIGSTELAANVNITQFVEIVPEYDKRARLVVLLDKIAKEGAKVLIFIGTKRVADDLTKYLRQDGWPALAIHGDKLQPERDHVLSEFRTGRSPIMIATDVASRGLDVKDVGYVINYDMPNQIEDYIHRIGRTGRAGNKGTSYAFVTPHNGRIAGALVKILRDAGQVVPSGLEELDAYGGGSSGGGTTYTQVL